jgi:hypothetical protein
MSDKTAADVFGDEVRVRAALTVRVRVRVRVRFRVRVRVRVRSESALHNAALVLNLTLELSPGRPNHRGRNCPCSAQRRCRGAGQKPSCRRSSACRALP